MLSRILARSKSWQLVGGSLMLAAMLTLFGGIFVYLIEGSNPASPINSLHDGLHWAVGTITRVGYGDLVPVTFPGRVTSVVLAMAGFFCTAICLGWAIAKLALSRHQR